MNGLFLNATLPAERIRQGLDEVLHRPEFRSPESASPGWLIQLLRDIAAWFGRLRVASPVLFWLLLIVCLTLLALLVLRVTMRVRRAFYVGDAAAGGGTAAHRVRLSA